MPRLSLYAVSLATGLVLLSGCGLLDGADEKSSTSGTPSAPAAPTDADAVPATPSGSDPAQPAPAGGFESPQAAVQALIDAWNKGDKQAALKAAGPNTVEKVFAGVVNVDAKIEGCQKGSESGVSYAWDCYYRYDGGSSHFYVDPYPATKWRVVNFTQVAD
ncbi:hypothetical protein [Actinocorallia aurantiaca]|uniref:Lipoprotein n=1 Tax=Actinocorallia aurantiaca TaxID=46204 RepID=A0ABP6GD00_9ACTN